MARVIIEGLTNPIKLPSSDLRGERASGILKIYDTKGSKCMATRFPASVAPQLATQMAFTPDQLSTELHNGGISRNISV